MTEQNTETPVAEAQKADEVDKYFDEIFIAAAQKIAPVLLGKSNTNSEDLNDGVFCAKTKKPKASSQVYCIDGKWGTGKSSLKSYIEEEFKKEQPYIIEYSAWEWQEQSADLRLSFFDELGKQLKNNLDASKKNDFFKKIKNWFQQKLSYIPFLPNKYKILRGINLKLDAYKNKLNPQPDHNLFAIIKDSAELTTFLFAITGGIASLNLNNDIQSLKTISDWCGYLFKPFGFEHTLSINKVFLVIILPIILCFGWPFIWRLLQILVAFFYNPKKTYAALSLQELKKEIQEDIAELTEINHKEHQKIIVFLDDLDRLNQQQIADVMQLVKANSDFEHMVFVLLMDKAHVEKQLNELYHTENFLEKIVQQTFEVPKYERDSLFAFKLLSIKSDQATGVSESNLQEIWQAIATIHPTFRSIKAVMRDVLVHENFYRTNNFSDINLVDLLIARTLYFYHPNLLDIMMQNLLNKYPPQKYWDELFKKLINNKNDCKNHEPSLKTLYDCLQLDKPYAFKEKIAGYSSEENIFYYDIYQQFWLPNPLPLGDVESFLKKVESADFANFQDCQNNEELIQYFESKELPQSILNFLKIKNYIGSLTVLIKLLFERIESWSNNAVEVDETTPVYKARRNIVVFYETVQIQLLKDVLNMFYKNTLVLPININNMIFSYGKYYKNERREKFYNLDTLHTDKDKENFTNELKEHINFSYVAQLFDDSADSQNQEFYQNKESKLFNINIQRRTIQGLEDFWILIQFESYNLLIFQDKKAKGRSGQLNNPDTANGTSSTLNNWSDFFNLPQEQQLPVLYFLWHLTKYAKDNNWQT